MFPSLLANVVLTLPVDTQRVMVVAKGEDSGARAKEDHLTGDN